MGYSGAAVQLAAIMMLFPAMRLLRDFLSSFKAHRTFCALNPDDVCRSGHRPRRVEAPRRVNLNASYLTRDGPLASAAGLFLHPDAAFQTTRCMGQYRCRAP